MQITFIKNLQEHSLDREEFLKKGFTFLVGKACAYAEDSKDALVNVIEKASSPEKKRPPGAIKIDENFKNKCTGCDQCMIACPLNVILIDDMDTRYPFIYSKGAPCLSCENQPCISACSTGALDSSFS